MTNITNIDDVLSRMPWTRDQLTREQFDAWLASRKEAGRVIDIETCELGWWGCCLNDPYEARPDAPNKEYWEWGRNSYVRSAESRGWICEDDLPPEKYSAMRGRLARSHRLFAAACAMHPLWECAGGPHLNCYWNWKGDGEAPSQDEMIEWFKVNYPAQARECEVQIKREVEAEAREGLL
jgi:hypothetical protein